MGLIETLNTLIDLCISIQNQLSDLTELVGKIVGVNRSLIDLSAMDVMALEKNVQALTSYRKDVNYVIETLEKLSGNIQILFWLLVGLCIVIAVAILVVVCITIFENRVKILNWIKSLFERIKK